MYHFDTQNNRSTIELTPHLKTLENLQVGLEPTTPFLKEMCPTYWAIVLFNYNFVSVLISRYTGITTCIPYSL